MFGWLIVFVLSANFLNGQNPKVSRGELRVFSNFPSKYVDTRTIAVWLPENYDSTKSYPVLLMHDGQMLFDSLTTWNKQEWRMDEIAQDLIDKKQVQPFVVVGIWNNGEKRRLEYLPEKAFRSLSYSTQFKATTSVFNASYLKVNFLADEYLKFVTKEVLPFVRTNFAVSKSRENTYIGGSSFGGMISWYALCRYPQVFGGAVCLSTHWPVLFPGTFIDEVPKGMISWMLKNLPKQATKIYFDYGTATLDAYYEPWQKQVDAELEAGKYPNLTWKSLKFEGENHSEVAWAKRLDIPLFFVFGK
ncbi:MAG: hypothetical protein RL264_603 [Bacteroidota bacterium]